MVLDDICLAWRSHCQPSPKVRVAESPVQQISDRNYSNSSTMLVLVQSTLALLATRLIRGWNQTGQKHAGEPDVAKSFLVPEPTLLWLLVGATYFLIGARIHRQLLGMPSTLSFGIALFLVGSASTFKLAFTHEDAPELVIDSLEQANAAFHGLSLVFRARIVFIGLGGTAGYALYHAFRKPSEANKVGKSFSP